MQRRKERKGFTTRHEGKMILSPDLTGFQNLSGLVRGICSQGGVLDGGRGLGELYVRSINGECKSSSLIGSHSLSISVTLSM